VILVQSDQEARLFEWALRDTRFSVFRVTPRKRLKELDPFLNKQTVDVLKETQAGGGIVEHLFCFLVLRFVNVNEWGTCEVR